MIERILRPITTNATEEELAKGLGWLAFGLAGFGVVMIFAATYLTSLNQSGKPWGAVIHQVLWLGIGLLGYVIASRTTPYQLSKFAPILLIGTVGLLGAVLVPGIGSTVYGSTRWIVIGPLQIQPSELAKAVLVLHLCRLLAQRQPTDGFRRRTVPVVVVMGVLCALILIEPDMGTSILVCLIGMGMLIGSGTRVREMFVTFLGIGVGGAYFAFSTPYRRARMLSFLHPWAHRSTWSYQEVQSLAAFATGHLSGVGLGAGQSSYSYLPNAQTDFIFAVVGQDLGFLGAVLLLGAFFLLILVVMRSAKIIASPTNALFCFGVAAWIGGQVVLNVGAVEGLLPVTGVPLPLVSAGGSSTVVLLVAVGVIRGALRAQALGKTQDQPSSISLANQATKSSPTQRALVGARSQSSGSSRGNQLAIGAGGARKRSKYAGQKNADKSTGLVSGSKSPRRKSPTRSKQVSPRSKRDG